ncbi:MAG TPA: hypothetical protein GXZ47_05225, partial [Treponema sp.]|nr:hypothetical protein [Treponema sp.]
MPDFDNDEIRDSSFPNDFNDEKEALDMYGVWVKSGPRDVSSPYEEVEDVDTYIQDDNVLPDFEDVPDISDFGDLPDIQDMEDDLELVTFEASPNQESDSQNNEDTVINLEDFDMEDDTSDTIEKSLDETPDFNIDDIDDIDDIEDIDDINDINDINDIDDLDDIDDIDDIEALAPIELETEDSDHIDLVQIEPEEL